MTPDLERRYREMTKALVGLRGDVALAMAMTLVTAVIDQASEVDRPKLWDSVMEGARDFKAISSINEIVERPQ